MSIDSRLIRALLIAALVLAVAGILLFVAAIFDRVHNTLVVIVLSVLFAYAVYPPIKWIARHRVPVAVAALIVYVVLGGLAAGAIAWLTPAIVAQTNDLIRNYPRIVERVRHGFADPSNTPVLNKIPENARREVAKNTGKAEAAMGGAAGAVGANALGFLGHATAAIVNVGLMLGLTFLIITDLPSIQAFGVRVIPPRARGATIAFMTDVDQVVGGFVRGQVALALGVAVVGTLVLLVAGVPYAILLGLLAGAVSIVPIVGPIVAILPVALIAILTVGVFKTIVVVVLYALILGVQQNVLVPLIVSRAVGVTPLVIFVAILFGSEAFGVLGALLSIPIAGILRVAAERIFPMDTDTSTRVTDARKRQGDPDVPLVPSTEG